VVTLWRTCRCQDQWKTECALVRTWPPALRNRCEPPTTGSDRAGLVRPLRLPILRRLPARCNRRSLGRDSGLAGLDCLRAACGVRSSCRPVFEHPASRSLRDLRNVTAADGRSRCGSIPDEFCYVRSSRRISAVHQVHRPLVSNLIPDGDGISAF